MSDPGRKYDYDPPRAPQDPFNPVPPERSDPLGPEPLTTDLSRRDDIVVDTSPSGVGAGNGLLIAAVVVILAAVAFYIFGPGANDTTPTAQMPTPPATENAQAPAPAPAENAQAPATGTDNTTTGSTTPNPPADDGAAGNSAAPADGNAAPAPKPIEPAPAPAQ